MTEKAEGKKGVALIGLAVGLANGLFGSGGGTIAVPAMQKLLGVETHKSHATAIAVILPLSFISLLIYMRSGFPEWAMVAAVSLGGVVGGLIGARLLNKIKAPMLHKIFGTFMIIAAVRMMLG